MTGSANGSTVDQKQSDGKIRDPKIRAVSCWINNIWVILLLFILMLSISLLIFYYWRPTIVLDDDLDRVEAGRIVLTSIITASITVIAIWIIIEVGIVRMK